jgi:transcriptional regulator with XRE-family HTH domain
MTRRRYPFPSVETVAVNWRRWMQALGEQQRRIREFLGLSQEELARLAGVSQGSISRMESGAGVATPMLVVLKVSLVLARGLQSARALLNEGLKRGIDLLTMLHPAPAPSEQLLQSDPGLEELLRLYQDVPEAQRASFLGVIGALVEATRADAPDGPRKKGTGEPP